MCWSVFVCGRQPQVGVSVPGPWGYGGAAGPARALPRWHALSGNGDTETAGSRATIKLSLVSSCRSIELTAADTLRLEALTPSPVLFVVQVVGLLSDLLRHPSSGAYAAAWRSDTNLAAAPQLLLSLWIREEDRLQVHDTQHTHGRGLAALCVHGLRRGQRPALHMVPCPYLPFPPILLLLQVTRPGGVIENLCSPLAQHVCPRPPMSAAFAHLDDALSAASSTEIAQVPHKHPDKRPIQEPTLVTAQKPAVQGRDVA